jgi:uncharacterized membrane protein HdeD (DUF308 family)
MSAGDSQGDDGKRQWGKTADDPAHQGAKPGSVTGEAWAFFKTPELGVSEAMSALLAQNWWAIALRGVFALLFGIAAVLLPGLTLASLVLLYAAYMLVDGVLAIVAGLRAARRHERWGWLVVEGIADLIAGSIAFAWPLITVLAFVFLMAAWAIVSGVLLLSATFSLQATHGKWLMGFGAVVSVVWGVLLIVQPFIGALALTWWMGAYALFFGGALLALAFRLRRRQHGHPPAGIVMS